MSAPRAGDVYRAPSGSSFRYLLIEEVRHAKSENDAYVNAIEITEDGKRLRPSKHHPFRALTLTIKLAGDGSMPFPYEPATAR